MRFVVGGLVILLFPSWAASQSISIDTTKDPIATPTPLDVRNRDVVTVNIKHVPIVECKVETGPDPNRWTG